MMVLQKTQLFKIPKIRAPSIFEPEIHEKRSPGFAHGVVFGDFRQGRGFHDPGNPWVGGHEAVAPPAPEVVATRWAAPTSRSLLVTAGAGAVGAASCGLRMSAAPIPVAAGVPISTAERLIPPPDTAPASAGSKVSAAALIPAASAAVTRQHL
jgi:hypothetical protein